jgi:uncharacterized membrane protein
MITSLLNEPHPHLLYDAVWQPNYSASHKKVVGLLLAIGIVMTAMATYFFSLGAWPVLGFCGVEWGLLYWGFLNYAKRAASYERIIVTRDYVEVEQLHHPQEATVKRLPTGFLSLYCEEGFPGKMWLRSPHAGKIKIGQYIGFGEKLQEMERLKPLLR